MGFLSYANTNDYIIRVTSQDDLVASDNASVLGRAANEADVGEPIAEVPQSRPETEARVISGKI